MMKKLISMLMCFMVIITLIPQQRAAAYNTTSLGTIVSGQEYSGVTPVDAGGNHIRVRYELPVEQNSIIRIILYTQKDSDTSISLDSINSPYETENSFGSFPASCLTSVGDFYDPLLNVYSTSCYGLTADMRNTAEYTEVFGDLAAGSYYIILSGSSYRFKVFVEPLMYQGDISYSNSTLETAAPYIVEQEQEGVLITNGIVNNSFIDYNKTMNSWYKFTAEKGSYHLSFQTDGFFQGSCNVLGSDGYLINSNEIKAEAYYTFSNGNDIRGTFEEHLTKAGSYDVDFDLPEEGTYYVNINRKVYTSGSYSFQITSNSETAISSIAIDPNKASIKAGATLKLKATAVYSDTSSEDLTEFVTWTSSNTKIATVNDQGVVKGVTAGTSTIKASIEGKEASITVTITAASKLSKLAPAKASIYLKVGATVTNKITAYYSDGTKKDVTANVTYKSSSASLTISKKGVLKATKKGTYTVTVTYGGKKVTFKVIVK